MFQNTTRPLTFETLVSDPLTRMLMDADGVTPDELAAVMHAARKAVAARRMPIPMRAAEARPAMSARV
jgi:hypothetical protein